uniref:Uncharacterized protein n=1 Tax=Glossina austeni TaxID=7395 RepID=A0A1A9ULW4_GLOAU
MEVYTGRPSKPSTVRRTNGQIYVFVWKSANITQRYVIDNEIFAIHSDKTVPTDDLIVHNRPDIMGWSAKKREKCASVPNGESITEKYSENLCGVLVAIHMSLVH